MSIGFQHNYRGFLLSVMPTGAGFKGEVRPATPEAEEAVHGFTLTRGNLLGQTVHEAAKLFFADAERMIDKQMPPA